MHLGDVNQGITIGTATFASGEQTHTISLDASIHPTDLSPAVQLTPIGAEQNINTFTSSTIVVSGAWVVSIARSAAQVEDKVNYMIISRIESLILGLGVDEALKRAKAYIKSGADGIMIHSREKEATEVFEFCKQYSSFKKKPPLIAVPSSYNRVTENELFQHGVNIVIYANHLLRASYPAMISTAKSILTHSRSYEIDAQLLPIKEILELIPGTK